MTVTGRPPAPGRGAAAARGLLGVVGTIVGLNAIGWGVLLLVVVPQRVTTGSGALFGAGLGLTAFLLGARHAFDADHITVIDNTTRKLVGERRPALAVGLWFSLGHSTVVFGLSLLIALGLHTFAGNLVRSDGPLPHLLEIIGGLVAAAFLLLVGLSNLAALRGLLSIARRSRQGDVDEDELEDHLQGRGVIARLLRGLLAKVRRARSVYGVGLLMGLGFDTASQVGLLVLAGSASTGNAPWYAILVLPVLFAAGMTLFDGAEGMLMTGAYRWAFLTPLRRIRYNILVTGISIVAALLVAAVVLLQTATLITSSPALAWAANLDLQQLGLLLVAVFAVIWAATLLITRGRSPRGRSGDPSVKSS